MKLEPPRIFSPFGIGPANMLRRCDGTYRRLTWWERVLHAVFGALPADAFQGMDAPISTSPPNQ